MKAESWYLFWMRVKDSGKRFMELGNCWEWTGPVGKKGGHGIAKFENKRHNAHKVSWLIAKGPIPDGLCVLHYCDNPLCVNPSHLFLGTFKENSEDREAKGRGFNGIGERKNTSIKTSGKLSSNDVRSIRKIYKSEGATQRQLAFRFGVRQCTISQVLRREIWKHI